MMERKIRFAGIEVRNHLIAASSPLTETVKKVKYCREAGFGGVILKTAAAYQRSGNGYGRKVVFIGEDYFADASFEREILTKEEGEELYQKAQKEKGDMLIVPSVSADSIEAEDWLPICCEFDRLGAKLIQLDFFYLGTIISKYKEMFYLYLEELLQELQMKLSCRIMPKLNFHFDPECVCRAIVKAGVKQVSLLDSIRVALPERFGLHPETTSYFGGKQLPLTLEYLRCAMKYGLDVCAGGGVCCAEDVNLLLENGATLVQTASYVLKRGFAYVPILLQKEVGRENQKAWCDADFYGGIGCEKCGFCLGQERLE